MHYTVSRFVVYIMIYDNETIQICEVFQSPELVRYSSNNIDRINLPVSENIQDELSKLENKAFLLHLVILIGRMHRTHGVRKKRRTGL